MVSIVEEISRKFDILEGAITTACDGLNVIKKSMGCKTRYLCLSNQFDLISVINHRIIKDPLTWSWIHVKGHQDDQTGPLDRWASLNVECDTAAKQKRKQDQKAGFSKEQYHNIQYENWRLFTSVPTALDGKIKTALGYKVSTNLKYSIYNAPFKKPFLDR